VVLKIGFRRTKLEACNISETLQNSLQVAEKSKLLYCCNNFVDCKAWAGKWLRKKIVFRFIIFSHFLID